MADAWTVQGVELPEDFDFPITKLGTTSDIHGKGAFVNTSPTRVKCHVHVEARPESPEGSACLEILPYPLHPDSGTELEVAYEFEQQFFLALWLYRGLPSRIVTRPGHQRAPVTWSLRGQALADFLRFSQALLDFHDDRQAYFFARYVAPRVPGVLEDDDLRVFFIGGHRINADWLKARWPVMAATDLYERGHKAADADIEFLLLMLSMEVLFTTDGMRGVRDRLSKRCALLNGRDFGERETIRDKVRALYKRRSWLVHGDLFDEQGFLDVPHGDTLTATELVRLSLLRFIALGGQMKTATMASLDRAESDARIADSVHAQVKSYWDKLAVDRGVFDMRLGENT
jgi:hypothetical protein